MKARLKHDALSRKRRDDELNEEIQTHIAMAERDRIERGEDPQHATAAARREFGNHTRVLEVTREAWGWIGLERFWQDIRYAVRGMRRNSGFTAAAVLSLALGIGANTAIFSLIHRLLLNPLPVANPRQLVEFLIHYPGDPPANAFSWGSYEYFRDHNHVFAGITGEAPERFMVQGDGLAPETIDGERVMGNYFRMFGLQPAIGRLLSPEDGRSGNVPAAVVSWPYWKNRFNLDPAIVGRRIIVDGAPATIAGVAPRGVFGLQVGGQPAIWLPFDAESRSRAGNGGLRLVARLKPNVMLKEACAEMALLFRWTLEERIHGSKDPAMRQLKFTVEPAGAGLFTELRKRYAHPLLALMALVVLLLLLACSNVASLLLARGAARQRELALRISLGASRFRLVRQALTEALLLSATGGLLGVLLAYFSDWAIVRIIHSGRHIMGMPPRIEIPVNPDSRVLLLTAATALVTALLFGMVPAWNVLASAPIFPLRDTGKSSDTRMRRIFGKSLVAAQVAFSVGLLSAASIFAGNLAELEHADLGFRRDHVVLLTLDAARSGYTDSQISRAYHELLAGLAAIPGVRSASLCAPTPLSGAGASRLVTVEGHPERPEDRRYVAVSWVAPRYFDTLGTPLLAGRDFTAQDANRPPIAIINEAMARHYFGQASPLGKYFSFDGNKQAYQIVGVAANANYYEIREPQWRTVYLDAFQDSRPPSAFVLRTAVHPHAVTAYACRIVRAWLKNVPITRITTLADQVDASIVPERLIATISLLFGLVGVLLAALGLYGLLAYTVARRVSEIGVRMALGASRGNVMQMVLSDALGMVCVGLAAGMPLAFWANRYAATLLTDLPPGSIVPIAWGAAVMVMVALIAAYLPARRAARVDPLEALRYE